MVNGCRLISLDEALKATHSEIYWTESQQAAVRSFLVKQPKVDAVEVVRCKECEFCHYNSSNDTYKCSSMNGMYRTVKPDDFCSYGERRTNHAQEHACRPK